jgi:hyperosmotically inducible periplasmic protein
MKIFVSLLFGIIIGAFAVWIYRDNQAKSRPQSVGEQIKDSAQSAGNAVADKWRELKLSTGDITNELASTGQVIREKARAAGQAIADATAEPRTTATIKGKLMADSGLSSLNISVNTTGGVVTLSGMVSSADQIVKAMQIAMEVDGVSKVISTLQVKTN